MRNLRDFIQGLIALVWFIIGPDEDDYAKITTLPSKQRGWSLTFKVSLYATALTLSVLVLSAALLLSVFYKERIRGVDAELANNAEELRHDLQNFRGAPLDARHPLSERFIPVDLHDRLLILSGPEGQVLYASPGLEVSSLGAQPGEFRTVTIQGQRCRVGFAQHPGYTVELGMSLAPIIAFQHHLIIGLALTLPLIGVVVFAGAQWMSRRAIASVTSLTEAAENIGIDRLAERLPMPTANDEVARLTRVLNAAFARLQAAYEAASRFSADASHQMKTPVAVLRLSSEALRKKPNLDAATVAELDTMQRQVRRLSSLMDDLLMLASVDAHRLMLERQPLNLSTLALSAIDDLSAMVDDSTRVESEVHEEVRVHGDARYLAIIIQNLVENAGKYTPEGGTIWVAVSTHESRAKFTVTNTGTPIPKSDQSVIFERFRRGSQVGEGTKGHGLGLNICRELARAQGGDVVLSHSVENSTAFELTLPLCLP